MKKKVIYFFVFWFIIVGLSYIIFILFPEEGAQNKLVLPNNQVNNQFNLNRNFVSNACNNPEFNYDQNIIINDVIDHNNLIEQSKEVKNVKGQRCVELSSYLLKDTYVFSDVYIDHIKGTNNKLHQPSYSFILENIKAIGNKKPLDKSVVLFLTEFALNNQYSLLFRQGNETYMFNGNLIGPNSEADSGRYYLNLDLEIIKIDIKESEDSDNIIKTIYVIDDIISNYQK